MTTAPDLFGIAREHLGFRPLHDWIVVLADTGEMQTAAGLFVAASEEFRPGTGTIVSLPQAGATGLLSVGDRVLFSQFAAQPVPTQARPDDSPALREARSRLMLVRFPDVIGRYP